MRRAGLSAGLGRCSSRVGGRCESLVMRSGQAIGEMLYVCQNADWDFHAIGAYSLLLVRVSPIDCAEIPCGDVGKDFVMRSMVDKIVSNA